MYEHTELQMLLKQRVEEFSDQNNMDWVVECERYTKPPVTPGSRRIDVAIETDQNEENRRGYAVEIKTASAMRYRVFGQLRDQLVAGFQSILIAPESFLEKTLPRSPEVPLAWAIDSLDTSFVTVTSTDPLELRLVEDNLPAGDPLNVLFSEQHAPSQK